MAILSLDFEQTYGTRVAGIDEAGRGPLAGPVVACAVTVFRDPRIPHLNRDSKRLTERQRTALYAILTAHPDVEWGIGKISEKTIDTINIFQATKRAMRRAVNHLERKLAKRGECLDFLLLDGNFLIDSPHRQQSIIKGDETVFSCAAASIIAKVTRDRIMDRCHSLYPEYGFDRHKGYGTPSHMKKLRKYGPCPIHRRSFRPVNAAQKTSAGILVPSAS